MTDYQSYAKSCGLGCLGLLVLSLVVIIAAGAGITYGSPEMVSTVTWSTLVVTLLLLGLVGFLAYNIYQGIDIKGFRQASRAIRAEFQQQSNKLGEQYESEVRPLKKEARQQLDVQNTAGINYAAMRLLREKIQDSKQGKAFRMLQAEYGTQGSNIDRECRQREQALCDEWLEKIPTNTLPKQWVIRILSVLAVMALAFVLFFNFGAMEFGKSNKGPAEGWSAATIELPHLSDGSLYVSNPDSVLTAETEAAINHTMLLMDDELGIESAVIAVRHVENGDVFRFAQDLFDRYGIGKDDRGLVIVLAVDDRHARIHTGNALEADFTDIETRRLQDEYLVPFMKLDMPNEGLKALTDACYSLLSHKDMPVVHVPTKPSMSDEDKIGLMQVPVAFGSLIWSVVLLVLWNFVKRQRDSILPLGVNNGPWAYDTLLPSATAYASNAYGSYGSSNNYSSSRSYHSSSRSYSSSSHRSGGYHGGGSRGGGSTSHW